MPSLKSLRVLVLEALTCVYDAYRAPPTKTPLRKWCTKMQNLFVDIEAEKKRLEESEIEVPPMPQCTHLIELGLCVATKEFDFAKLRRSLDQIEQDVSPRELLWSELGKGPDDSMTQTHKRTRDIENREGHPLNEKRTRVTNVEPEEAIAGSLVLRKDNPCDRCRNAKVAESCYFRPLSAGGVASNCFRCFSLKQRCETDARHVRWQLITGRYIGISDGRGRSGNKRQRFYYEKAPVAARRASTRSRSLVRCSVPRQHPQASVAEIVPQIDLAQQPSTSQFRITVEASTVPQAPNGNTALILRSQTQYPLTPPHENRPLDIQRSHFSLSPTPSSFITSNLNAGNPQDKQALTAISHHLHSLQASFTRVEDKVHLLVNKGSFDAPSHPSGINVQLLELDIGESLGDKLAQLERGSEKFEATFLKALTQARPTSQAPSQTSSARSSPGATAPLDILKVLKDVIGKLQRKAELSSTYIQFARVVDPHNEGKNVKLCQDAKEDVKELSRRLRRLCAELKESFTPAEHGVASE